MNTPHSVSEIARRLPERTTREVQDVIDVLLELWQTELLKPDLEVRIALRKKKPIENGLMHGLGDAC